MSSTITSLAMLRLGKRLKRAADEHKGNAGKALLIGGAPGMAGALLLAGNACLHLGAGWTTLEMLDPASAHVCEGSPELMIRSASADITHALIDAQANVIAIGPGLGKSEFASAWLKGVLEYSNVFL